VLLVAAMLGCTLGLDTELNRPRAGDESGAPDAGSDGPGGIDAADDPDVGGDDTSRADAPDGGDDAEAADTADSGGDADDAAEADSRVEDAGGGDGDVAVELDALDDGDAAEAGTDGDAFVNACGGTDVLDPVPGEPCGTCDSGEITCAGPNSVSCVGDEGEAVLNACGGCEELAGRPGERCRLCGRYVCSGAESLLCESGYCQLGEPCASDDGCTDSNAHCSNAHCAPVGFAYVPPGRFSMGSPPTEAGRDVDETAHEVVVTWPRYVAETEVTRAQWHDATTWSSAGFNSPAGGVGACSDCAVGAVTFWEAVAFANGRSAQDDLPLCYDLTNCSGTPGTSFTCTASEFAGFSCRGYRLPSEAEWEQAARAGTTSPLYNGLGVSATGDNCVPLDSAVEGIAWYCGNAGEVQPVGGKLENPWGLFDVSGNVWELCFDVYWDDYELLAERDPWNEEPQGVDPLLIVRRSGGVTSAADRVRSANRGAVQPNSSLSDIGLRLARTAGECDWVAFDYDRYALCWRPETFLDARNVCTRQGMRLALADDDAVDSWLLEQIGDRDGDATWWAGGSDADAEGTWRWLDGRAVTDPHWLEGEPDDNLGEDCLGLVVSDDGGGIVLGWNDVDCALERPFFCEEVRPPYVRLGVDDTYHLFVNGSEVFTPVHDDSGVVSIVPLALEGPTAIGVVAENTLGSGGLIAEIVLDDSPDSRAVASDTSWRVFVAHSSSGELAAAPDGWSAVDFDDSGWLSAVDHSTLPVFETLATGFPESSTAQLIWSDDADDLVVHFRVVVDPDE
jgi:formylglycine-generating enzyme required for sulfatase activity